MKFLKNINRLPWKYVIGINGSLVVAAITFVSITTINRPTENRSQAKEPVPSPALQIYIDNHQPPALIDPDISWGKVGDAVLIKGKNLGTLPYGTLKIGNVIVPVDHLIEWQPDHIVFTIPDGAITAPITLAVTNTGTGKTLQLSTQHPLTITTINQ